MAMNDERETQMTELNPENARDRYMKSMTTRLIQQYAGFSRRGGGAEEHSE